MGTLYLPFKNALKRKGCSHKAMFLCDFLVVANVCPKLVAKTLACTMNMWVSKKPFWRFHRRFSTFAPKGWARSIKFFRLHGCHHFSAIYMCWLCFLCFSRGLGPGRTGRGMAYATDNQPNHNKSTSSWFFICGFCSVVLLMSIWVGGAPGWKKTRQPRSQKPCLLLLETWQCERCNWQVAMCNGQIEIMDASSLWISIGIRSYQSPMWNMQRLYTWGGIVFKPEIFPEVFPYQILHAQHHSQINGNIAFLWLSGGCVRIGIVRVGAVHHICNFPKIIKSIFEEKKRKPTLWRDQSSYFIFCMRGVLIGIPNTHLKGNVFHRKQFVKWIWCCTCVCHKLIAKTQAFTMEMWVFWKNRYGTSTVAFRYAHERVVPGPSRIFAFMVAIIFQQMICVDGVLCVSQGQGPERRGRGSAYDTDNQQNHNEPASSCFSCVAFAALFFSCQLGVVELRAGITKQPTSQKPCRLLLETWQCEKCNWQVAICNGRIEIMDYSSLLIPIRIHSYQSPMWKMQRLYRWGAWCSSPKSSQRFSPPNLACTTPLPNQGNSCLSTVVGWVCTNRYRLCGGRASYLQFAKNKNLKKNMCGEQSSCNFSHGGGPVKCLSNTHLKISCSQKAIV